MRLAQGLAARGESVDLFEGAPSLGGLAGAWTLGEVVWDRHYHVTLPSDAHLLALLEELGLKNGIEWRQTRTGFYAGGRLHSLSNSLEFLRFPLLGPLDKARLAATIFYASRIRNWRRLERVPVSTWLVRWSGRTTFERIWLPLLRAKLGDQYRITSAAFIWTTIARMYAARRAGMKRETFGYVPGGYARILDRFAERIREQGVRIHLSHAAQRVERRGDGVAVEFGQVSRTEFDRVVLTVPGPVAARLCPGLPEREKELLAGVRYQGLICASLLTKTPLSGFYITNITDSGAPFTGVIEMSALVGTEPFGGYFLVYLPGYMAPDDAAFDLSDEHIEERFLTALEKMYPEFCRSSVAAFRVSRVRYVFPIPTLDYSRRLPPMKTSLPGVWIVNSAHILNGTLNVNETLMLAERALAGLQE